MSSYTMEEISYIIGQQVGQGLKQQQIDVVPDVLCESLKAALSDAAPTMSAAEMNEKMEQFQNELAQKSQAEMAQAGEENLKKSAAFFVEIEKKDGVVKTDSGLMYEIITEGKGPKPAGEQVVSTHYEGTLTDGTIFDSSYQRGNPVSFPVNGVIQGWQEALTLMSVGSKWKLYIPADLAYGAQGSAPVIGPNEALVFDIELLGIEG